MALNCRLLPTGTVLSPVMVRLFTVTGAPGVGVGAGPGPGVGPGSDGGGSGDPGSEGAPGVEPGGGVSDGSAPSTTLNVVSPVVF